MISNKPKELDKIQKVLPEANLQDKPEEEVTRPKPTLEKYVRRHHVPYQIIGDTYSRVMTRKILRSDICLLCEFEPKSVKHALDNEH